MIQKNQRKEQTKVGLFNLFGNLFDFDGDGQTSDFEEIMGLGMLSALLDDEKKHTQAEELEEQRERLEELLDEWEGKEPDDPSSELYDRWEEYRDELEERIEEIEDMIDDL